MNHVLITGGTGLVGQYLSEKLLELGYHVNILSRQITPFTHNTAQYHWDIEKNEIDQKAFENVDAIIHLAGANIGAKRWSPERKKIIVESRIKSAQLILDTVKKLNLPLQSFISASAIGYYGAITSDRIFVETDTAAEDFLGTTCRLWEAAADQFEEHGARVVKIRTGIVLTMEGGALPKLILPVKLWMGAPIGNGRQFMPWIHIDDLCHIYIKAIEGTNFKGSYNAVAPEHITNREFTKLTARILNTPLLLPQIPKFIFKMILGEMSDMLTEGSRVSCEKILSANYAFKYPTLKDALEELIHHHRRNAA